MYSTSPMFGTNTTITGVTMSHPSQLATFSPTPPPPIFAHSVVTTGDGLLQPVTCMGLVATSSAAPPVVQQQQQPAANGAGGNGSIVGVNVGVGVGMSLYGSDVAKPQLLKTVPEELHHQLNGEEVLISQDRNHGTGTRF
ncbi:GH20838 [Drosophila grimshawi]|uniref:GH20838 n=2 Tax=Drosophila grimshawi TaxID=7222 RepID=B4J5K9_DROGR|nr:GH20838 [Drosophila grimshawi]